MDARLTTPTLPERGARGFSVIEALVAIALVTIAIASGARLITIARQANQRSTTIGFASMLAQQKMEQLRALMWGFDSTGAPVADTTSNLTTVPEQPVGGPGLAASPSRSLLENIDGYCDFLDQRARSLGGGTTAPAETAYVRRWSVQPLEGRNNTLVLQVLVIRWRNILTGGIEAADPNGRPLPDEARLISLKTRKLP